MIQAIQQNKISSSFKRSISNFGWIFFDRIFRVIASLFVGVWVARYLSPAQYGQWSYSQALPAMLIPLVSLGLSNVLIIKLNQKTEYSTLDLLGTAFGLKFIAGAFSCLGLIGVSYWLHSDDRLIHYLVLLTSSSLVLQSFDVIDLFFQANVKAKKSVLAKAIGFLLGTLLKVYLLLEGGSLFWFVATTVVEAVTAVALINLFYKQETGFSITKWKFNADLAKSLLMSSWPLMINDFFVIVQMRIDQIMLNNLVGSAELGKYSAALKLSESWYFIAVAIVNSFYPPIAKFYENQKDVFLSRYQKMVNTLVTIAFVIAVGVSLFSPFITNIIYGNKYVGVATILSFHVWACVPLFLEISCNNLFILRGLQKYVFWRSSTGALISILLNLLLIPHLGAVGASISVLLTRLVSCYLFNAFFPETRPIFLMQTLALRDAAMLKIRNLYKN